MRDKEINNLIGNVSTTMYIYQYCINNNIDIYQLSIEELQYQVNKMTKEVEVIAKKMKDLK